VDRLPSQDYYPRRTHDGGHLPRIRQAHERRPRRCRIVQDHQDQQDWPAETDQAHTRTRHHPRREYCLTYR
jgi:hypothetical protein